MEKFNRLFTALAEVEEQLRDEGDDEQVWLAALAASQNMAHFTAALAKVGFCRAKGVPLRQSGIPRDELTGRLIELENETLAVKRLLRDHQADPEVLLAAQQAARSAQAFASAVSGENHGWRAECPECCRQEEAARRRDAEAKAEVEAILKVLGGDTDGDDDGPILT